MESRPVGGVPIFLWLTRKLLPKNKMKREFVYKIRMVIFTYFIYALFNMSRRPLAVVKLRIIGECSDGVGNDTNETDNWCKELQLLYTSPQVAMGLLDFMLILSYGLCVFVSGIVADCFNPRYYLTAGCFFSGYICALMGLTDYWDIQSFKFKSTLMILFGAGQSTAWPVVLSSVTHWYGVAGKRRGMFYGFWNTHNYLGSVLGISLARIWVDRNFMWSFFVPGFILAAAGVLVFVEMVVDPKDLKQLDKEASPSPASTSLDRILGNEIPAWLSSETSITVYEALTLPGVIEFSICMFVSRMVGYTFLYWLPVFMKKTKVVTASLAAYYSLAYVLGGSIGGILAGIFVDLSKRTAIICALFLLLSIPILLLGVLSDLGSDFRADFPLFLVMGIFVEAPFLVISTSVSADLGTHKLIKKNYRALSTVGGIIEGTGALGAAIGTYVSGLVLIDTEWQYVFYVMAACQFVAILCLSRQAYKDIFRKQIKEDKMEEISSYLKLPSFN